jgi:hypothetical protein
VAAGPAVDRAAVVRHEHGELKRNVANRSDGEVTMLIASAPQSSGYEPMGWA